MVNTIKLSVIRRLDNGVLNSIESGAIQEGGYTLYRKWVGMTNVRANAQLTLTLV